jgi:hypothetical protein
VLSNAKTEVFKYFEDVLELKSEVFWSKENSNRTHSLDGGEVQLGYYGRLGRYRWLGIAKVESTLVH